MATAAEVLGVRLEKPGVYVLNPGAELPGYDETIRCLVIVNRATVLAFVFTGVAVWI